MFTSDSQYLVDISYFVYKEFSKLIVGDWARINLWNFLLFFVLPFLDFSSYLCFNICMKSWIWFIPEDLEDLHPGDYVHNQIILRNPLTTDQILQKNWKKLASSSTKKGAINKAWTRLSKRAGALFYKKSKLTRCINRGGGGGGVAVPHLQIIKNYSPQKYHDQETVPSNRSTVLPRQPELHGCQKQ